MSREYFIYNPQQTINEAQRGLEQSIARSTSGIGTLIGKAIQEKAANEELNKTNNETFLSNIDGFLEQADAFNIDLIRGRVDGLRSFAEKHFENGGKVEDSEFMNEVRKKTREINNIGLNSKLANNIISNTMKSLTNHIKSGVIRPGVFENVLALNTDEDVLLNLNPDQLRSKIDEVVNNHIDYETPSISFLHTNRGLQINSDNIKTETERDGKFDYEYQNTNKGNSNFMDKSTGKLRSDLAGYIGGLYQEKIGTYIPLAERKKAGVGVYDMYQMIADKAIEDYERIRYTEGFQGAQTDNVFEKIGIMLSGHSYFDETNQIVSNERQLVSKTERTDQEYLDTLPPEEKGFTYLGMDFDSKPTEKDKKRAALNVVTPAFSNILVKNANREELSQGENQDLNSIRELIDASTDANTESYSGEELINNVFAGDKRLNAYLFPQVEKKVGSNVRIEDSDISKANKQKIKELANEVEKEPTGIFTSARSHEDNMGIVQKAINEGNISGDEILKMLGIVENTTYQPNDEYILFEPTKGGLENEIVNLTRSTPELMTSILSKYTDEASLINFAERIYNRTSEKNKIKLFDD
tara:strand:- start:487 stop:2238 length:1752 start_codon:yes stop_codon:yes gene_type:complete